MLEVVDRILAFMGKSEPEARWSSTRRAGEIPTQYLDCTKARRGAELEASVTPSKRASPRRFPGIGSGYHPWLFKEKLGRG